MKEEYDKRLEKIEKTIFNLLPEKGSLKWMKMAAGFSGDNGKEFEDEFYYQAADVNIPALDLLTRGGKRWRPMLMALLCEAKCGDFDKALSLTPLVELPHNGSLIVDDIEDSSDFRRGKPAVHLIHGTDVSINSANYLYFLPSVVIDSSSFTDREKLVFYQYYTSAMRRLHLGQALDIKWHGDHSFIPKEKEYMQMCRFKTGALSRFAAEAGLFAAGADNKDIAEAGQACEEIGVGFQILDDVINLTLGNPGKKRGDDIVEGKKSLPVILCSQKGVDKAQFSRYFEEAKKLGLEKGSEAIENAIALLEKSGAMVEAEEKAFILLNKAKNVLASVCKEGIAKDLIFFIFSSFEKSVKGSCSPD